MSHTEQYLAETIHLATQLDWKKIEEMVQHLVALRERKGRLWIAGLGGSAANASHAANDFRQLCQIEAYCLTDNVAEITARSNDAGWEHCYSLAWSSKRDALLVLSVGGGTPDVSRPIAEALDEAESRGIAVIGIVGRDGGYTAQKAQICIIVPTVEPSRVTPHTEGWQSVILHCICSHPDLQVNATKW